jgi:isocitrate lyase
MSPIPTESICSSLPVLIHRYKTAFVHYLTPTDDNTQQTQKMRRLGIFSNVSTEIGQVIVAEVDKERMAELLSPDRASLSALICRVQAPNPDPRRSAHP